MSNAAEQSALSTNGKPQVQGSRGFDGIEVQEGVAPEHLVKALEVETLKAKFRRQEVSLDTYMQHLVDMRLRVNEEEIATSTGEHAPRPGVDPVVTSIPDAAPAPPVVSSPPSPSSVAASQPVPAITAPAPSPPHPAHTDRVIGGRFKLGERVGSGGTGDVYRARDLEAFEYDSEHATVAVKLLHDHVARNPDLLRAVLRGASTMRRLRHPNIGQVLEVHRFADEHLIVMEWLQGESLARRLDRAGPPMLPKRELEPVLRGLGAALDYAHRQGVAHGDVKPGNVLITADGHVKLLDFGFASPEDAASDSRPSEAPWGVTRIYASAEVLGGAAPTPADDVYSLACLTYRVFTGNWPYGARDALDAERAEARPHRPRRMSRPQWRALQQGLAFRRADRLESVTALVAPFLERSSKHRYPWIAGSVVIAMIGAALIWQPRTPQVPNAPRGPDNVVVPLPPPRAASVPLAPPVVRTTPPAPARPAVQPAVVPPAPVPAMRGPAAPAPATSASVAPAAAAVAPAPKAARKVAPPPRGTPTIGFASADQLVVSESDAFAKLRLRSRGGWRGPVVMSVITREGSASIGQDFARPVEFVTLSQDKPTAEILIPLLSDTVPENVEDLSLELNVVEGDGRVGVESVVVVLMDDD